jgi:hypothetical protein
MDVLHNPTRVFSNKQEISRAAGARLQKGYAAVLALTG